MQRDSMGAILLCFRRVLGVCCLTEGCELSLSLGVLLFGATSSSNMRNGGGI